MTRIWFNKAPVTHALWIRQAGDALATTKGGLSLDRAEGKEVEYTGSRIPGIGTYDNSPKHKWNPAPNLDVYGSAQSWDEMYQPFTLSSVDSQTLSDMTASKTPQQK